MEVRTRRPSRGSRQADRLTLPHALSHRDIDSGQVQQRAVQARTVIEHQQMPFQREGSCRRQNDDTVRRSGHDGASGNGDISPAMIAAGLALIHALGTEPSRQSPRRGPPQILTPALGVGDRPPRGDDLGELGGSECRELGVRLAGTVRRVDPFDRPVARCNRDGALHPGTVRRSQQQQRRRSGIAVERDQERAVRGDRHRPTVQRQHTAQCGATQDAALHGLSADRQARRRRRRLGGRWRRGSGVWLDDDRRAHTPGRYADQHRDTPSPHHCGASASLAIAAEA